MRNPRNFVLKAEIRLKRIYHVFEFLQKKEEKKSIKNEDPAEFRVFGRR